jgi:hypothetical protein
MVDQTFGYKAGSVFRTYETKRDLKLLLLDGITHGQIPGSLDLQDMIAFGQ